MVRDDQWILTFLRRCKFSLDRTKEKLDNFYTLRSSLPEFFTNRDPYLPEIQQLLKAGLCVPIDVPDGSKVILHRTTNVDPSHMLLVDIVKVCLMVIEIILNEDDCFIIHGPRLLIDLDTLNANHLLQVTPTLIKKIILSLKDVYPCRFKGFHLINMPSIFESILNAGKSFLGKKLANRVTIHSKNNFSSLYEHVPISALPVDYGGGGESLQELTEKWKRKVESYRDWFLKEENYGCDESKRISQTQTSDFFGINGSFRKLTID